MKANNNMEHLFKLKKNGKTVGYLELRILTPHGYPVLWFRDLFRLDDGKEWHSGDNIQADSIHPFVTKDADGKDIFADDMVYFCLYRCRGRDRGVIKWQQERYRYAFYFDSGREGPWGFTDKDRIELIEDEENESDDGS